MTKLDMLKKRAKRRGYDPSKFHVSDNPNKKFYLEHNGKKIYFGSKKFKDYLDHGDDDIRRRYRKRHGAILLKDGRRAIDRKYSPAALSYYLLW